MTLVTRQSASSGNRYAPVRDFTAAELALIPYWMPYRSAKTALLIDPSTDWYYRALGPDVAYGGRDWTDPTQAQLVDQTSGRRFMAGLTNLHPIAVTDDVTGLPALCFGAGGVSPNALTISANGDMECPSILVSAVETNRLPLIRPGLGYSLAFALRIPKIPATVTAAIASNVMTVSAVTSGVVEVGQQVWISGTYTGRVITALGTGTGGTGTYTISAGSDVGSGTVVCANVVNGIGFPSVTGGVFLGGGAQIPDAAYFAISQTNGHVDLRQNDGNALADSTDHRTGNWMIGCGTYNVGSGTVSIWTGTADSSPTTATGRPDVPSGASAQLPRLGATGATSAQGRFVGFIGMVMYLPSPILADDTARGIMFDRLAERIAA